MLVKTVGIIAEFNPFHTGHKYFIDEIKSKTKAENVIVVMSSNFVQRGEPAIFDKWTRTKTALLNGVDMLIELPVLYSTSPAPHFAYAAVKLLHDTGIVDTLCFGSESGDINSLKHFAQQQETPLFQQTLKKQLDKGLSFPAARANALTAAFEKHGFDIAQPNNILAIEYLKAMITLESSMDAVTISRKGHYHDTSLEKSFASATALRQALLHHKYEEVWSYLPPNTHSILLHALEHGAGAISLEAFTPMINYILRILNAEELRTIFEVTEGLEHRILRSLEHGYSISQLTEYIKSKRFTLAKIKRILLHALLQITKNDMELYQSGCPYIRLLGFRRDKQQLLSQLHQKATLPILTQMRQITAFEENTRIYKMLCQEIKATDLYFMGSSNPACRHPKQDFTTPMVMISKDET